MLSLRIIEQGQIAQTPRQMLNAFFDDPFLGEGLFFQFF